MVRYLFLRGTFEDRILLRLIAKYERMRSRLTFVPNTLGLSSSTDAAQERLLKGIMDDDAKLFKEDATLFDFKSEEETPVADEGDEGTAGGDRPQLEGIRAGREDKRLAR